MQVLWRVLFSVALGIGFFFALVWLVAQVITMDLSPEHMEWWRQNPGWGKFLMHARTAVFGYLPLSAVAGLALAAIVRRDFIIYGLTASAAVLAISEIYALRGWVSYQTAGVLPGYSWSDWVSFRFESPASIIEQLVVLAAIPVFAWLCGKLLTRQPDP